LDENCSYIPTTFELDGQYRDSYLTFHQKPGPKLSDDDLIVMADGTFKTAFDLQVGDQIKTVEIPNQFEVTNELEKVNYRTDYESLLTGTTYSVNTILYKKRVNYPTRMVNIVFDDDTVWFDTMSSNYLADRNNEIRFLKTWQLEVGDKLVLIDTNNDELTLVEKTVKNVEQTLDFFSGWHLTVSRTHLFLTKSSSQNTTSFVSIEHNDVYCNCLSWTCVSCIDCAKAPGTRCDVGGSCTYC
jgi:hypothetical protein